MLQVTDYQITLAKQILAQAGYTVARAKPRAAKQEAPTLNAVGKPYSPQFDPNYRMKYKPPRYVTQGPNGNGRLKYTIPSETGIPRVWEL